MNCEECNVDLLALAYGELEPSEAEAARERVGACPECQTELSRLEALRRLVGPWGAQRYTPPAATDDVILQAARAKIGAGAATAVATAAGPEPGIWERAVRWLATLAMGPQTAMATIMLLAIGIGLWYFPRTSERDAEATGGTVTQIPEGTDVGASVQEASEPSSDWSVAPALAESDADEPAPVPVPAGPPPTEGRDDRSETVASVPSAPATTRGARAERRARARSARPSRAAPAEAEAAVGGAGRSMAAFDRNDSAQARYQRGIQRQSQGDYRGAIDDFQEVLRAPSEADRVVVPDALRRLADSYQRSGRCDGAVPQYESLLRRFPSYRQAGDVQVDLARCYSQLGRVSDARNTLQQAARHPAARRRAESALRRLGNRSVETVAAPAGAPASVDTAASEAAY